MNIFYLETINITKIKNKSPNKDFYTNNKRTINYCKILLKKIDEKSEFILIIRIQLLSHCLQNLDLIVRVCKYF